MAKGIKPLPFDRKGGMLAINRRMLNSPAFMSLRAQQKVLIFLLHEQWRNDKPIAYSVREAAEKIPCKLNTACKAFAVLAERGFICCVELSQFNSRHGSRAREWRITWMPFNYDAPTNDWEQWRPNN
jgi:hypothetical protein